MAQENFDKNGQYEIYDTEYSIKVEQVGADVYTALAIPGSLESQAVWRAYVTELSGTGSRKWADGNTNFDNVATELSGLTYTF